MPKKKIYIDKVVGFKKDTWIDRWISGTAISDNYEHYMADDEELFLSCHLCFLTNEIMKNYIPDNARISAINLSFYVTNINWDGISNSTSLPLYFWYANTDAVYSHKVTWGKDVVISKQLSLGYNTVRIPFNMVDYSDVSNILMRLPDNFLRNATNGKWWYGDTHINGDPVAYLRKKIGVFVKTEKASEDKKPYIEIEYQYNAPQASNDLNPNGVTLNPRGPLRFSWNSLINQTQFEFQYRVEGKDWSTPVVEKTANRYYDMPSNTIREGSGNVEWRVRVMEESGVYSDWTTANFTIGVLTQEPPRIVRPLGDYVKNGAPTTFEWDFIAGTTEEQKAFEIEVVLPTETKHFSGQSTETKFTTDLGIKDSIVVYWRMRVQNSFDEWSEWTDRVSYQTIGVPPAPQIISVENNNRPLVQWTSREQESYQLQIEKVDGEVVFKTDSILGATVREYKVKEVLPNGKYVFVLKVTNSYGIESQPIRFTHIIDPAPISKPTIRLFKSDFFVQIESDTLDGEVLRDDKVIGYLKQGEFRDYTGANYKTYIYQVRTFEKDVMAVSDKIGGVTEFGEVNTLASVDDLSNCFKIEFNFENSVQKTLDYNIKGSEIELEGMKYPFVEFGEHAAAGLSLEFFVDTIDEVRELKKLIDRKKEFLLRESRGSNFQGVLFGFNSEYNTFGYKVSCTMTITGEDYE